MKLLDYKNLKNINRPVALFFMGSDCTLLRKVKRWKKTFIVLSNDRLLFDTLDESLEISIKDITQVSFSKHRGSLWLLIETINGKFTGCANYNDYKTLENQKIINYLNDKIVNKEVYNRIINSKNQFLYIFLGK